MENRHLCRAKNTHNHTWMKGYLVRIMYKSYIVSYGGVFSEVDPTTICHCTGRRDKDGKLIWENDIAKDNVIYGVVKWDDINARYIIDDREDGCQDYPEWCHEIEVIGNVFDNPEFLEVRVPCKVGTPVYTIGSDCGGNTLDCRCRDCECCSYYKFVEENKFYADMAEEIGKTVFLTREEAEAKLKEMEGKIMIKGKKVIMNNKYHVSEKNKGKIFEIASEPYDMCGTVVVKLKDYAGCYALDGLDEV